MRQPDWTDDAACAGMPLDIFYWEGRGRSTVEFDNTAKAICAGCPVIAECLAATEDEEHGQAYIYGIRGGTTPGERQVQRKWKNGRKAVAA